MSQPVTLTYTNWRGETAERTITPTGRILFSSNEWHPEPQWLVEACDARSGEVRLFALTGFGAAGQGVSGPGAVPAGWVAEAAFRAQLIRDTVGWLASHAKGMSLVDWNYHSNILTDVATELDKCAAAPTPVTISDDKIITALKMAANGPDGEENQRCFACGEIFQPNDLVLEDASGGVIHRACCGPDRDGFTGEDGGPLKEDDPIPEGWPYRNLLAPSDAPRQDGEQSR